MTWCGEGYAYRQVITIDKDQVAGDETNFPVLISVVTDSLRDTGNGGHVQSSDGYDIIFTNSDCTLVLKHEIERYVNTSGTIDYWVRIPELSSVDDTVIHMYYGKAGVVADPSTTEVWDANFLGVYHMGDTAGDCHDSTSNGNDGAYAGNLPTRIVGQKCGWAQDFDGSIDTINLPIGCHAPATGTFEVVLKAKTDTATYRIFEGGDENLWRQLLDLRWDVGRHDIDWRYAGNQWVDADPTDPDTDNHYYAVSFESGDLDWFRDTANMGSSAIPTQAFAYDNFYIGSGNNATGHWFEGEMSELRISDIKRSDNWLETTHNTQMSPDTFISFGAEEIGPVNTPPDVPSVPDPAHEETGVEVDLILSALVGDDDGDAMDVTFYDASDDSVIDVDLGVLDGNRASVAWSGLEYSTEYSWYVIADDGTDETSSPTWTFTTKNQPSPSGCGTFTIAGIETVTLIQPFWGGGDNAITKNIDRTSFWSGNYEIDDDGINSQPLTLRGIESNDSVVTLTAQMVKLLDMADNNEEVTISGLGENLNGVYVIKQFGYSTVKGAIKAYAWHITLEKVQT